MINKMKKKFDDDDGRTVVDMSDVSRPPLWIPRPVGAPKSRREATEQTGGNQPVEIDSSDSRAYVFGALGAALLVGGIFILAALIVILLLIFVWHVF